MSVYVKAMGSLERWANNGERPSANINRRLGDINPDTYTVITTLVEINADYSRYCIVAKSK